MQYSESEWSKSFGPLGPDTLLLLAPQSPSAGVEKVIKILHEQKIDFRRSEKWDVNVPPVSSLILVATSCAIPRFPKANLRIVVALLEHAAIGEIAQLERADDWLDLSAPSELLAIRLRHLIRAAFILTRGALLKSAIDHAETATVMVDIDEPDQPVVFASQAFERLTGYSSEEILGRNCRFLQGGDDAQDGAATIKAAIQSGTACSTLLRNYRKDGALFWNEIHLSPLPTLGGGGRYFAGFQFDVTKQVDIAKKTHDDNARFQEIADTSPDLLFVVSPDGRECVFANRALLNFSNYGMQAKASPSLIELLRPSKPEEVISSLRQVHSQRIATQLDIECERRDQQRRILRLSLRPQHHELTQQTGGVLGCASDVTELHNLTSLVATRQRYLATQTMLLRRTLLPGNFEATIDEILDDVSHAVGAEGASLLFFQGAAGPFCDTGRITSSAATPFLETLGTQKQTLGENLNKLDHSTGVDLRNLKLPGFLHEWEAICYPIGEHEEYIGCLVIAFRDHLPGRAETDFLRAVTSILFALIRRQQGETSANENTTQPLHSIDLQNVISAIRGETHRVNNRLTEMQILIDDATAEISEFPKLRELTFALSELISSSATSMREVNLQLSDQAPEFVPTDLNRAVAAVYGELGHLYQDEGSINLQIDHQLAWIKADDALLGSALVRVVKCMAPNLNECSFNMQIRTMRTAAPKQCPTGSQPWSAVEFLIRLNSGNFAPMTASVHATARHLVERMDGLIVLPDADTDAKSRMARLLFPPISLPPKPVLTETPFDPFAQLKTVVLIVEDTPEIARVMAKTVERLGYRSVTISNARALPGALASCEGQALMAIVDVDLESHSNGVEVAKVLRESRPEAKVIFTSGHELSFARARYQIPAEDHFLAKPFNAYSLQEILIKALSEG